MLQKITLKHDEQRGGHYAIVASNYNARYVNAMLRSAERTLKAGGAESIRIVRVPGAFEIPVVAATLAHRNWPRLSAIICLGVILRGATTHAHHIGEGVTQALARIQTDHEVPIIHEVLLLESEEQARERCSGREYNRGVEAAYTALQMRAVMHRLTR